MGVEITGKTLGIIGCGNIGSIVADRAHRPEDARHRLRPVPVARARAGPRRREGGARRPAGPRRFHHPAHADDARRRRTSCRPRTSPRRRRACASSTAPAAAWSTRRRCADALEERPCRRRGLRRLHRGAGQGRTRCSACPTSSARRISAPATNEAQENVALQVAEQMSDYLMRGAISNAINFPSITAEEAPKLKPFIALAEKLGSFAGQLTESGIKEVRITYEGDVARPQDQGADGVGHRRAAAAAARRTSTSSPRRSSPRSAASSIEETTRAAEGDYDFLITLTVDTEQQDALRRRHGLPRRQAAHRRHQGHQGRRRVRPLDDLRHQRGQARASSAVSPACSAMPASTSPPSRSAATRRAARPSRSSKWTAMCRRRFSTIHTNPSRREAGQGAAFLSVTLY